MTDNSIIANCRHDWSYDENIDRSGWHRDCRLCGVTEFLPPEAEKLAQSETTPRCGDHVKHAPSGETWIVAYADPVIDQLAWAGWPNGTAKISDCEITKRCTDQEHRKEVEAWRNSGSDDGRKSRVLAFYGGANAEAA
jgi:hypothetical protein